jgi:hypothetical protein
MGVILCSDKENKKLSALLRVFNITPIVEGLSGYVHCERKLS